MYCIYCGSQIPDESVFCTTCGKKLSEPATEETPVRVSEPVSPQRSQYAADHTQQQSSNPGGYQQQYQQVPFQNGQGQGGYQQQYQPPGGTGYTQAQYAQSGFYTSAPSAPRQPIYQNGRIDYGCPMNWYKFLIYFALIPNAFVYLTFGAIMFIGSLMYQTATMSYGGYSSYYSSPAFYFQLMVPNIFGSMLLSGLICLVFGAVIMVTWVKLLRLKKGAWHWHIATLIVPIAFMLFSMIALYTQITQYIPGEYVMEYMTWPLVIIGFNVLSIILQLIYFKKRDYLFIN